MSLQKKQYLKHIDYFVRFEKDNRDFYFPQKNKFSNLFSRLGSETRKEAIKNLRNILKQKDKQSTQSLDRIVYSHGFDIGTVKLQALIEDLKNSEKSVTKRSFLRIENYLNKFAPKDSLALYDLLLRIVFPGKNHISTTNIKRSGNPVLKINLDSSNLKNFINKFEEEDRKFLGKYVNGTIEGVLYSFLILANSHKVLEIKTIQQTPDNLSVKRNILLKYEIRPKEMRIPIKIYLKSVNLFSKHGTSYYSYNLEEDESLKQAGMLRGVEAVMQDCYGNDVILEDINLGKTKVCFVRGKDLVLAYGFQKFREEIALKFFMQNLFFDIEQYFKQNNFDINGINELPPHLKKKMEDELESTSLRRFFSPFKPIRILQPNPNNLSVAEKQFFVQIIRDMSPDMTLSEVVALMNSQKHQLPKKLKKTFKPEDFTLNNVVEICDVLQGKKVIE